MAVNTECAESQETRVLPLLSPRTRAKHDLSKRSDTIPLFYAEMAGEELDRRINAAREILANASSSSAITISAMRSSNMQITVETLLNWRNWPPHVLRPIISSSAAYTLWLRAPIF